MDDAFGSIPSFTKEGVHMTVRGILRLWFVSMAVASVSLGCGGTPPEGNLPPQKPASEEELKKADQQLKDAMKNMGKPAP